MSATWRELTIADLSDEVREVVRMVIEGWYADDEPLDAHQFLDHVEGHLFSGDPSERLCLPSDMDHEVNRTLLRLGRAHRKAIRSV